MARGAERAALIDAFLRLSPVKRALLRDTFRSRFLKMIKGQADCGLNYETPFETVYLSVKITDIVSGGVWGRRPHTLSEPTMLVNNILE